MFLVTPVIPFIPLFSFLIFTSYFFFFRTQDFFLICLFFVFTLVRRIVNTSPSFSDIFINLLVFTPSYSYKNKCISNFLSFNHSFPKIYFFLKKIKQFEKEQNKRRLNGGVYTATGSASLDWSLFTFFIEWLLIRAISFLTLTTEWNTS